MAKEFDFKLNLNLNFIWFFNDYQINNDSRYNGYVNKIIFDDFIIKATYALFHKIHKQFE